MKRSIFAPVITVKPMKTLCIMIKPASSQCNLRCKYCFYADVAARRNIRSFGRMTDETMQAILTNIRADLESGDRITFAFQGGEPTLAGLDFFQKFIQITNRWESIAVSYSLQTNAVLLDDAWCAFLKKNKFLVGVSWDILPECHDDARVDGIGKGTNRRVREAISRLKKWGIDFNILCTLTNRVARHPRRVWNTLVKENIEYVQFTPCLGELSSTGGSPYTLTPKWFSAFYDQIFELWYGDYRRGIYRSVKLIDDVVNLLACGKITACGIDGRCSAQIVVESDGSVYPCDFYCVDEYLAGNLARSGLRQTFESEEHRAFRLRHRETQKLCRSCEFSRICAGGCERMQAQMYCEPEGDFCGYRTLLKSHWPQLMEIIRQLLVPWSEITPE